MTMCAQKVDALILAGGRGLRLRSLVADRPKPMADVDGRPFLEYLIKYWMKKNISRFVFLVGYKASYIKEYFGSYKGAEIIFSIEEKTLGTGGALKRALQNYNVSDPFLLINGDTFFDIDLSSLLEVHLKNRADITFSLSKNSCCDRYESILLKRNNLVLIGNENMGKNENSDQKMINGGIYLISQKLFQKYPIHKEFFSFEKEYFSQISKQGARLFGYFFPGKFVDIGVPKDYTEFCEYIARKREIK